MSDEDVIDRDAALSSLPPEWKGDGNGAGDGAGDGGRAGGGVEAGLARTIAARVAGDDQTIVVLDDDPTGTQTVYDLPVLTVWSEAALDAEFGRGTPAFYVMTNSRSMGQEEAAAVGRAIAGRLRAAAARHGRRLSVISRSDSTLRGHYPLEIDVLAEALSGDSGDSGATTAANAANANAIDGQILVPFFLEGGRLTLDDVHYVAEGDRLVPAAQTPFARDHAFGFTRSNLRDYVEEKTGGRIGRDDVESITLDDLRTGGPTRVRAKLSALRNMCACIVNAVTMRDVQVFALGLLDAEARDGRRFLVRSAASFVQARIGLPKRPILDAGRIRSKGGGAGAHGTGAGGGRTAALWSLARTSPRRPGSWRSCSGSTGCSRSRSPRRIWSTRPNAPQPSMPPWRKSRRSWRPVGMRSCTPAGTWSPEPRPPKACELETGSQTAWSPSYPASPSSPPS